MTASVDRRQAHQPRRDEEIVSQASRMFLEKGFQSTTMRELARALDLDAGSLYRYFPSKGSIFVAMGKDTNEHIVEALSAATDATPEGQDKLKVAFTNYVKLVDRFSDYYRLFYRCFDGLPRELWKSLLDGERGVVDLFKRLLDAKGLKPEASMILAWDISLLGEMWAIKRWAFDGAMDVDTYIAAQWRVASAAVAGFQDADQPASDPEKA